MYATPAPRSDILSAHAVNYIKMKKVKKYFLLFALAAVMLLSSCNASLHGGRHDVTTSRPAQTDSPPETSGSPSKIIITPSETGKPGSYSGYTFRVLEKAGTDRPLTVESDALQGTLGATVTVYSSAKPADDVSAAMLSGGEAPDAMLLPLDELSSLFRSGYLENLAALGISPLSDGFQYSPAASIAVTGRYYIAFGDISPDSILSIHALKCDIPATLSNEIHAIFGKDIRDAALAGEFTTEKLMRALKDSELITSSTSKDAVLSVADDDSDRAALALLSAAGGSLIDLSTDAAGLLTGSAEFSSAYLNASNIYIYAADDGSSVFSIEKFGRTDDEHCYLPLPKPDAEADYRCLADTEGTYGWAVPLGVEYGKRTADITTALFAASVNTADSYFSTLTEDETGTKLARLIFASRVYSISDLYDWGGLSSDVSGGIRSGKTAGALLEDSKYAQKSEAALAAIKIFTDRLR